MPANKNNTRNAIIGTVITVIGTIIVALINKPPVIDPPPLIPKGGETGTTRIIINQKIHNPVGTHEGYAIVKTNNGNGVKLSVAVSSIPQNIERSQYKLVAFAKYSDNPNWTSQGCESLSSEPVIFDLALWNDPKGDKSYYKSMTILSSNFNDSDCKAKDYKLDDLKGFVSRQSDTLTFYRDDSANN
ncbi:hypothetical protein PN450_20580 [Dolichospermum lemmermannii CS-548]|uniref:hypothetical protein n=1 Tax=Dolichospermum lemmermannii TaxID=54295 RepID=UPI00232C325D|nr:hypothetical protein [Dolichospermum lemmermannii]MDB9439135.1 hypothetical protein [Dolichospermum lemmermannii CS-548]